MVFPLIAMAVKKLAAKGAQKVAQKGAQKAGQKVAEKGAEKGTKNIAQKGLQKLGSFEKSNYKSAQKAGENGGNKDEQIPDFQPKSTNRASSPVSFHKGGKVKKGGKANVLKGEEVLTAKEAKKYHKLKKVSSPYGARVRTRKVSEKKRSVAKKLAVRK
jgi:hypothetical protein